jgi:hypothetical protein
VPRRPLLALVAVVAAAPAAIALAQTSSEQPSDPQTFFRDALLADAGTSASVKTLLRSRAGFVDPRSGFVDVTGDGKSDALVLITIPGQAGSVALYVFSTDGGTARADSQALRVVFRTQQLYRGAIRLQDGTLTVRTPTYERGDAPHAPGKFEERDYLWNARTATLRRVARRTVDGPGAGR